MGKGNKYYCDICKKNVETVVKEGSFIYNIKGSEIEVNSLRRYCEEHNHTIYDFELDNESTKHAIKKYNLEYGINPEDIKKLRSIYNISQGTLGKILGVAKKTINAYEQGSSVPQEIYKTVLNILINDPKELLTYAKINIDKLSSFEIKKIFENEDHFSISLDLDSFFVNEASEYTGYQYANTSKIKDIILRISKTGIGKTKLAKALFLVDALSYSINVESITGLNYAKMQHGPMPDNFDFMLSILKSEDILSEDIIENGSYAQYTFKALQEADDSLLSRDEISIVNKVIEYIDSKTAGCLSELTHELKCYRETENHKLISFAFLDDFDLIK